MKDKKIDFDKLISFGFVKSDEFYRYETKILDDEFLFEISVTQDGTLSTRLTDLELNEEYVLHKTDACGKFVGTVRTACEDVLQCIVNNCCIADTFTGAQAKQVIDYIFEKYGDQLEYLWEKFKGNAIWRRKDNRKWYALLVHIKKSKIGLDGDELIDIIDVRADTTKVENLIDNHSILKAYHMNKKHWLTICLDGSVDISVITRMIDESYVLAAK